MDFSGFLRALSGCKGLRHTLLSKSCLHWRHDLFCLTKGATRAEQRLGGRTPTATRTQGWGTCLRKVVLLEPAFRAKIQHRT